MNERRISLEELMDELRTLNVNFDTDEFDGDVFVIKPNDWATFSEDMVKTLKIFLAKQSDGPDEAGDEEEEDDIDSDDFDNDLFLLDDEDDVE